MVQNRDNLELEIILTLLKDKSHVRSIAKQLNRPHSSVLRKLNRLRDENAIDFKKEGKNKVFFIRKTIQAKSYVFSAESYKMSTTMKQYPELSVIMDSMLKVCREKLIILFGSYAKGTAKKDSDIDIYIETNDVKAKEKVESLHSKISVKIGNFETDSPLIREIIKNHVIIKGLDEFYEKTGFFE